MKKIVLTTIFALYALNANAQKVDQFNSWWYYSGKYRLSEKFALQTLYSWSRHDFVKDWQQSKLRLGVSYDYLEQVSFGAGYEWIVLFPYGAHPVPEKRTAHRIYESLNIKNKIGRVAVNSGLLLEHRFMEDKTRHRLRIILGAKMPIAYAKDGTAKLGLSFFNQVFLDIDRYAKNNHFRQNRIYGAFDVFIHKALTVSIGYMNQYIIISNSRIENDHTLMIGFFHKLDFRK